MVFLVFEQLRFKPTFWRVPRPDYLPLDLLGWLVKIQQNYAEVRWGSVGPEGCVRDNEVLARDTGAQCDPFSNRVEKLLKAGPKTANYNKPESSHYSGRV